MPAGVFHICRPSDENGAGKRAVAKRMREGKRMELLEMTALELGKKIKEKDVSAPEAAEAALDAIRKKDPSLRCFLTVDEEAVRKRAKEAQRQIENGSLKSPLAGVPLAVKDNICTKGLRTTCGSKMLEHFIPAYSAQAVLNLERAGMIVLGKTNMDEFAMGSTTETSYFGATKNPWKEGHVAGGSSGGSCAAVAAGECAAALGSDTGGSVRQPSAFCGVTGMLPTYGTVSRYGLVAYASSFDQIGPVARDVADCAAMLELLAGRDEKDFTSVGRKDADFSSALLEDAEGMRIGLPLNYFERDLDEEVRRAVWDAAEILKSRGAVVEEFQLSLADYAVPAYYIIACAQASSNLARFDGVRYGYRAKEYAGLAGLYQKSRSEGFGPEARRRILTGSFVLSEGYYDAYYLKAMRARRLIREEFDRAFARFDAILAPAAPSAAPAADSSLRHASEMYRADRYTVFANLAGLCAVSLPCGATKEGLPIGMQLVGDSFQEKKIIRAAYAYERARGENRNPGGRANGKIK